MSRTAAKAFIELPSTLVQSPQRYFSALARTGQRPVGRRHGSSSPAVRQARKLVSVIHFQGDTRRRCLASNLMDTAVKTAQASTGVPRGTAQPSKGGKGNNHGHTHTNLCSLPSTRQGGRGGGRGRKVRGRTNTTSACMCAMGESHFGAILRALTVR